MLVRKIVFKRCEMSGGNNYNDDSKKFYYNLLRTLLSTLQQTSALNYKEKGELIGLHNLSVEDAVIIPDIQPKSYLTYIPDDEPK